MSSSRFGSGVVKVLFLGGVVPIVGFIACPLLLPDWKGLQAPLHSTIEAIGLFAGVSLAVLLILLQKPRQDTSYFWIASALMSMGILDGFHGAVVPSDTFVWLHGMATLVGGLLFAMIWLSVITPNSRGNPVIPVAVTITVAILGILSVIFAEALPAMLSNNAFTPAASMINNIGGILFVVATVGFLARHWNKPVAEEVLFAAFCLLNGAAGLLFQFSHPWDAGWWLWHGLRLIAYVILLGYIFVVFRRTESRATELATSNQRLQGVTREIEAAVNLLGSSASEILAATTQVASGTAETAASISETTTTVEEVRQAAQLSSQKAKNVSDSAQQVAQVTHTGQKAVEETAAVMRNIRDQMESIAQTIVRLSEQGQSIGGIIASVTDIADQSNLLAVNAAIEAARAGEQGKGFAVVAQEIKSLAEQSKHATAEVRGILNDVQKATSAAVMATEQGSKAVEAGVKQSSQAGEAIRVLAESTGEAVQAAVQIVASSQQQVVGMDQIGTAMESINQAGAENAASMRQAEASAQNLHELGQKLKELVERFKT